MGSLDLTVTAGVTTTAGAFTLVTVGSVDLTVTGATGPAAATTGTGTSSFGCSTEDSRILISSEISAS